MPLKKYIYILILSICAPCAFCQDTLQGYTYEELDAKAMHEHRAGNLEKSRMYSTYQLAKAKKANDSLEITFAYYPYMLSKDYEDAIIYTDSAISFSTNSKHKLYPAFLYLFKGNLLRNHGHFKVAMDSYLTAKEHAELKENQAQLELIKGSIASMKRYLGEYEEALQMFKEAYDFNSKQPKTNRREKRNHLKALYNLSLSYLKVKKRDSARFYFKIAADKSKEYEDRQFYENVLSGLIAQIDFYDGHHQKSLDTILKYISTTDKKTLSNSYYYAAKVFNIQDEKEKAIEYYLKMDSAIIADNHPFFHSKDGYYELANIYKDKNDTDNHLFAINRYLWVDSVLIDYKEALNPIIRNEFDRPEMMEQRQRLLSQSSRYKNLLIVAALILTALLIIGLVLLQGRRKLMRKINTLIEAGSPPTTDDIENLSNKPTKKTNQNIPEDILGELERSLLKFEKSDLLLDKSLTLTSLAKHLDTNSTYLSSFINTEKGMNFPSYLKQLRVKTAIDKLRSENEFLKYSLNGLADEFGFHTADAFSRAFQKQTGIKASQFLKQLKKREI